MVSGSYNQSFSALLYGDFKSSIDESTLSSKLASPFPPSFLETCSLSTSSLGCNPYAWSFVFLFSGPFVYVLHWSTSGMIPNITEYERQQVS